MPTLQQNDVFSGHYLLRELVGRGGFSEVWKTEDLLADGVIEAIKIYAPESGMDETGIKQFKNEYITIRSLDHPHLMQVYRFDIHNGIPFLVMPYMEKGSLGRLLYEHGPLAERDIALLMKQVSSGLTYLHSRKPALLHQDIKPDNILITNEGSYKLADFGISSRTRNTLRKVTGQKQALALAYAPPERFAARPVNNEAGDIFSFGVTLYEACTGEVPWIGNGGLGLLQGAEIPDLPPQNSRILNNIIKACMSLEWEHRPSAKLLEQEASYFLENDAWRPYGRFAPNTTFTPSEKKEKKELKPALITTSIFFILTSVLLYPKIRGFKDVHADTKQITPIESVNASTLPRIENSSPEKKKVDDSNLVSIAGTSPPPEKPFIAPLKTKGLLKKNKEPIRRIHIDSPKSYENPETLRDYLMAIRPSEIPLAKRQMWSSEAAKMFASDAIIYDELGGTIINEYNTRDFLKSLITDSNIKNIRFINREDDATGKVQKLHVQIVQR